MALAINRMSSVYRDGTIPPMPPARILSPSISCQENWQIAEDVVPTIGGPIVASGAVRSADVVPNLTGQSVLARSLPKAMPIRRQK